MKRHSFSIALLLLGAMILPTAARADPLDYSAPLSDLQLRDHRGGFVWQGVTINLGADIRTYLNGELALQTIVTWNEQGATTSQQLFGALTPAGADHLREGVLTTGGITMRVGDSNVFLANEGQTALIHRTDGAIQNILLNTASNTNLRQEAIIQLDLGGFSGFATTLSAERLNSALGNSIGDAVIANLGH